MAPRTVSMNVRFNPTQQKMLARLAEKLQIGKTDVLRMALARLADAEGVLPKPKS